MLNGNYNEHDKLHKDTQEVISEELELCNLISSLLCNRTYRITASVDAGFMLSRHSFS